MPKKKKPDFEGQLTQVDYELIAPKYKLLATNLVGAVRSFLEEEDVPILDVTARVKEFDSMTEKIRRKGYAQPWTDIEDVCGLRVVCYYPADIARICRKLTQEFTLHSQEDTSARLGPKEFGYRSTHLIVSVPPGWANAPNYRGLHSLRAEIQIRTILMHAWAEIEHKLAYKSDLQVPPRLQRNLYRLSAKFEEADEQFEALRTDLVAYRSQKAQVAQNPALFASEELNLETLLALLDANYPQKDKSRENAANLLEELHLIGISMKELVDAAEAQRPLMSELDSRSASGWAQVGAMRNALDLSVDKFYESRYHNLGQFPEWKTKVDWGRKKLGRPVLP